MTDDSPTHRNPSRRDFMRTCGLGILAGPAVAAGQNPASPQNVKILQRQVLKPSDLLYLGLFKLPSSPLFSFSRGAMTARTVGGSLQFIVGGKGAGTDYPDSPIEVSNPGYGGSLATAPTARLLRQWGDIYDGKRQIVAEWPQTWGFKWFNGQLYWTFTANYDGNNWNLGLGTSVLNDSTGGHVSYGAWRASLHSGISLNNHITDIPAWFQAAYRVGPLAAIAGVHGGQASSPWGATVLAFTPPANGATPDPFGEWGSPNQLVRSVAMTKLSFHDIHHPQPRGTNFIVCGWNPAAAATTVSTNVSAGATVVPVAQTSGFVGHGYVDVAGVGVFPYTGTSTTSGPGSLIGVSGLSGNVPSGTAIRVWAYDNTLGGPLVTPAPVFSGDASGMLPSLDWVDTGCWVETATKHGVLLFGQMVDTIPGYPYANGAAKTHVWYGSRVCPHGQDGAPVYQGTGPGAGTIVNTGWIYDPMEYVKVLKGEKQAHELLPSETFQANAISGFTSVKTHQNYQFGGMHFDSATQRVYLIENGAWMDGYDPVPVVHVFQVR